MAHCFKRFMPPKAKLGKMTFEFLTPTGVPASLGNDNSPPTAVNESVQIFMVFEVTTVQSDITRIPMNIIH